MAKDYSLHDYKQQRVNIQQPELKLATFNPINFEYKEPDPAFFKNAIDTINQNDKENNEKWSALNNYFAEQRKLIHNDKKSYEEFDKFQNQVNTEIKNLVNSSFDMMHTLGAKLNYLKDETAGNKVINGMVQQNAKLEKTKELISQWQNSGKLDDIHAKRLLHEADTKFDNNFMKNNNGEVIGVGEYKQPVDIRETIKAEELVKPVLGILNPNSSGSKNSKKWAHDSNENGEINRDNIKDLNGSYMSVSGSSSSSSTTKILSKKQIDEAFNAYILADSTFEDRIMDLVANDQYEITLKQEELKSLDPNSMEYAAKKAQLDYDIQRLTARIHGTGAGSGGIIDAKNYWINNLKSYLEQANYKDTFVETEKSDMSGANVSRTGQGKDVTDTTDVTDNRYDVAGNTGSVSGNPYPTWGGNEKINKGIASAGKVNAKLKTKKKIIKRQQ